jgi:PiT family inorganic phosphate transporter
VLSPRAAVIWAAAFNFIALWIFGEGVAKTISKIIHVETGDPAFVWVVLCGLIGAITWNLITWWWALPSSSSHALIGGVGGSGVTYATIKAGSLSKGLDILVKANVYKTVEWIFIAPIVGFFIAGLMMLAVSWIFRRWRPRRVDKTFRIGQLISAAAYSIGHGGNDAQKTMGIILAVLIAGGYLPKDYGHAPTWVVLASYGAMAFGTAIGGWRIVRTMGMGLTNLKPVGGFCAEIAGAITLFTATHYKVPVSTTHTITGAIVGVGTTNKVRGVRWSVAARVVWAWIFTIPAAAAVGSLCFYLANLWHPW